jgi:hypothetical protein
MGRGGVGSASCCAGSAAVGWLAELVGASRGDASNDVSHGCVSAEKLKMPEAKATWIEQR